jgi:hypothetical protein
MTYQQKRNDTTLSRPRNRPIAETSNAGNIVLERRGQHQSLFRPRNSALSSRAHWARKGVEWIRREDSTLPSGVRKIFWEPHPNIWTASANSSLDQMLEDQEGRPLPERHRGETKHAQFIRKIEMEAAKLGMMERYRALNPNYNPFRTYQSIWEGVFFNNNSRESVSGTGPGTTRPFHDITPLRHRNIIPQMEPEFRTTAIEDQLVDYQMKADPLRDSKQASQGNVDNEEENLAPCTRRKALWKRLISSDAHTKCHEQWQQRDLLRCNLLHWDRMKRLQEFLLEVRTILLSEPHQSHRWNQERLSSDLDRLAMRYGNVMEDDAYVVNSDPSRCRTALAFERDAMMNFRRLWDRKLEKDVRGGIIKTLESTTFPLLERLMSEISVEIEVYKQVLNRNLPKSEQSMAGWYDEVEYVQAKSAADTSPQKKIQNRSRNLAQLGSSSREDPAFYGYTWHCQVKEAKFRGLVSEKTNKPLDPVVSRQLAFALEWRSAMIRMGMLPTSMREIPFRIHPKRGNSGEAFDWPKLPEQPFVRERLEMIEFRDEGGNVRQIDPRSLRSYDKPPPGFCFELMLRR